MTNKYLEKIARRINVTKTIHATENVLQARDGISSQFKARNKAKKKKTLASGKRFNRYTMRKE